MDRTRMCNANCRYLKNAFGIKIATARISCLEVDAVKSSWKIAALVSCVILICGAAIAWHFVKARASQQKLADEARELRARAEQGDAGAQFNLAGMYYYGKGVPQDYSEAARWCRKAAEQGYAKAQYALGYSYFQGKGVPQDHAEAARWYQKAADQGDATAQEALGFLYYQGHGVPGNYGEAARWYRKAAEQGYSEAECDLGYLYYKGKGVPQDYPEAVLWYRKAADQDYAEAQYALGYMYYRGEGVPPDRAEANRWFQEAARRGDADARRFLGSRESHIPTWKEINLSIISLGSLFFLLGSLKPRRGLRNRQQRIAALAGLLGLSYAGFDLYWYLHFGLPLFWSAASALYFAKHLLGGICVAMLLSIIFPKSARIVLGISIMYFVVFNFLVVANYYLSHHLPSNRAFCLANGLSIGISIPSAVFVWLDRKRNQGGHHDSGDVAAYGSP